MTDDRDDKTTITRRGFVGATLAAAVMGGSTLGGSAAGGASTAPTSGAKQQVPAFALDELTIEELQGRMQSGQDTAQSLSRQYLERIAAIDQRGPSINSVIELNPDALAIARLRDEERKAGKTRGPLHGIPVLIKDNIDTADHMHTTAGSLALAGHIAAKDCGSPSA